MTTLKTITGHCFCKSVQYSITLPESIFPLHSGIDLCTDCRRAGGALVFGWILIPPSSLTITEGESNIKQWSSSPTAQRRFASCCGTQLFFVDVNRKIDLMDVATGSLSEETLLDEENIIRPRNYAYWGGRMPEWLRGLLPPAVENGSKYPFIGADCVKGST